MEYKLITELKQKLKHYCFDIGTSFKMWFNINYFTLIFLIIFITIKTTFSISCYQCNSTDLQDQFKCTEFMNDADLMPTPCTEVYNAAFCIKLTGRYEGGLGVKRYCSSHDLGNYCDYIKQPGDSFEYRTCVYTCNSDGCNGSNQNYLLRYLFIFSFLPIIKWLII
ncbi:U-scoloptoxin(05)-Cw1a [Daktulosphaira vitifoliae]|uniref:U-scoloptoxin(05)-Cw1a n=1 Tax=Daktulosphaira vitifoliae TaxID=58002 RepID=UPI0021AA5F58|nr:U-scoloptoxin(05)-Cw1a [Daktulosphaira vitifoliae]